jgi:hypothetical protein
MIWLNIKEAERKLSANELTDSESFKYLLGIGILASINGQQHFFNEWLNFFDTILSVLTTIWGLNKLYQTNNLIDGQDFYKRLFVLTWVTGWRICVYLILPIAIIEAIFKEIYGYSLVPDNITAQTIQTIVYALITVIYFIMINSSFKRLLPGKSYEVFKTS